jgi:hypothetical protein
MSPEQIQRSNKVDPRTDVWALGVMLYELIAGALPYQAASQGGLFVRICIEDPIPLVSVVTDVPRDVAALVSACMARMPDARFATGGELAAELRRVLARRGLAAPEPGEGIAVESPESAGAAGALEGASPGWATEVTTPALPPMHSPRGLTAPLSPDEIAPQHAAEHELERDAVAPSGAAALTPRSLAAAAALVAPLGPSDPLSDRTAPMAPATVQLGGRASIPSVGVPEYLNASLRVQRGQTAGRVFRLTNAVTVVGRGASADLRIADEGVSREHFNVSYHHATREFRVNDMGSSNGTLLNGSDVTSYVLRNGDRLVAGAIMLVFEVEASGSG